VASEEERHCTAGETTYLATPEATGPPTGAKILWKLVEGTVWASKSDHTRQEEATISIIVLLYLIAWTVGGFFATAVPGGAWWWWARSDVIVLSKQGQKI